MTPYGQSPELLGTIWLLKMGVMTMPAVANVAAESKARETANFILKDELR